MNPTGKQTPAKLNPTRVIVKAFILFLIINFFLLIIAPQPGLGRLSLYNRLFPGRERLPYGDNPSKAYNLSLYDLEAMFASHELAAGAKPDDEFRVIIIGDSSTWGFLLPAEETLSAQLNQLGLQTAKGETIRFYNLGFPVMSLTKDLLILSYAMRYEPDLIIWPLTLESFPYDKQLFPPLLQNNPEIVQELIDAYDLKHKPADANLKEPAWWEKTIFGQRRALADIIRLQLYGILWAATGIDQEIPEIYTPRQEDLAEDQTFHDLAPSELRPEDLALDVLKAGMQIAGDVPVLLINEPMFISQGDNSAIRYNFFYPRWAYDGFRKIMSEKSKGEGWHYLDLWDAVSNNEFTNSAVHLTAAGTKQLAERIVPALKEIFLTLEKE